MPCLISNHYWYALIGEYSLQFIVEILNKSNKNCLIYAISFMRQAYVFKQVWFKMFADDSKIFLNFFTMLAEISFSSGYKLKRRKLLEWTWHKHLLIIMLSFAKLYLAFPHWYSKFITAFNFVLSVLHLHMLFGGGVRLKGPSSSTIAFVSWLCEHLYALNDKPISW